MDKKSEVGKSEKDKIGKLDSLIESVSYAQSEYALFNQEQVDRIFRLSAIAANEKRIHLAKAAVEETGMGIVEDKVIKNHFASEFIFNKYKDMKTCGFLEEDQSYGIKKLAEPLGVICGIIPTTNPTSTVIFKALIALKTRNAIIFSPHPRARKCTIEAAKIIKDAAEKAGAPAGLIGWIEEPSLPLSNHIMKHKKIALILATGGPGMVKAAYSSGRPAIGVGAGNTPALMDETANVKMTVNSILMSKTFDNGVVCASEQSVIVHKTIYDQVKKEFKDRGAVLLNKEQTNKLRNVILDPERGSINPDIVGQKASKIAEIAGFSVPETSKVLSAKYRKYPNQNLWLMKNSAPASPFIPVIILRKDWKWPKNW